MAKLTLRRGRGGPTLRQRLSGLVARLRRPQAWGGSAQRLEEAISYFAMRSNPLYYTANAFLGQNTCLALLHGRYMMYLDTRGTDLAPHVMMFGTWETNYTQLFQRMIKPGDTVFDIGAHLGVYTILAAAAAGPTGRVHAFEPNNRFAQLLTRSVSVNGFGDFTQVHNLAVGEDEAETELRFSWEYAGGGHLGMALGPRAAHLQGQRCRVAAIDALFADPAFQVDVLKMDVEGTETFAIRGMQHLLARSPRARLMFEFAPQMLQGHGSSAAELLGLLQWLGFSFWSINPDSSVTLESAEELATRTTGVVNLVAARHHPEA